LQVTISVIAKVAKQQFNAKHKDGSGDDFDLGYGIC